MKYNMQKFELSRITSFRSFALPIILIFQISLAGAALGFGLDGNVSLQSYNDGSCSVFEFCIEDVEDKNIKLSSLSLDLHFLSEVSLFSIDTDPLNNYIHSLNHSRSPPVL